MALGEQAEKGVPGNDDINPTAGPALMDLPIEILLQIVLIIGIEDINEDVKAIACFPMTSKKSLRIAEMAIGTPIKELLSLEYRFGKPEIRPQCATALALNPEHVGFKGRFSKITVESTTPNLAYLELDGSLSWLLLPRPGLGFPVDVPFPAAVDPESRSMLVTEAERLHLRFPLSFLTMMSSFDLDYRYPLNRSLRFEVGSRLVKCPSTWDRNAGGYILRFVRDVMGSWYAVLYLDRWGQHCVLFSVWDPNGCDRKAMDGDPVKPVSWCLPKALDFEEFLYHIWMDELCWSTLLGDFIVTRIQLAYLGNMQRAQEGSQHEPPQSEKPRIIRSALYSMEPDDETPK